MGCQIKVSYWQERALASETQRSGAVSLPGASGPPRVMDVTVLLANKS